MKKPASAFIIISLISLNVRAQGLFESSQADSAAPAPAASTFNLNGYVRGTAYGGSKTTDFANLSGEFALKANEVEPVIRVLTDNGVEVTAIHSHMLTEQPRLFYVHCWATGNATKLASTMREALDETNSKM